MGRSLHTAEAKRSTSFSFVFHMHFLSIRFEKRSEVCFEVDRLLLRNFCVRVSFAFFFAPERLHRCIALRSRMQFVRLEQPRRAAFFFVFFSEMKNAFRR